MFASVMFGPNYEPQEPSPETIELFDTVGEAIEALFDRHRAHGRRTLNVDLLAGYSTALTFPAFGIGTAFQLFEIEDMRVMTPERIASVISVVNTGRWDWYLILESHDASGHELADYVRTHRA